MKLILASQNRNKLVEMQQILGAQGYEVVLQSDLGLHVDVEETGKTFEENSFLKAEAVMRASGMAAIADDSGLAVDALDGAPGVYSARYGGRDSDAARNALLLENMRDVPDAARTGRYVSVITCVMPNGDTVSARGEIEGVILRAPQGTGGFGYDPLFYIPPEGMTFAEMPLTRKNQISHRAIALAGFAEKMQNYREEGNADK